MSWPSIDHSLISPSGHISKRARAAALRREYEKLFAGIDIGPQAPKQPSERERLLAQARELRELAAGGMYPRKYTRLAEELEKKAGE